MIKYNWNFPKVKMATWNEICQVLHELRIIIFEVQIELADPGTVLEGFIYNSYWLPVKLHEWK